MGKFNIAGIFTFSIMGLIGLMFIMEFVPELETAATGFTSTSTIVAAMVDMSVWIIPIVAIVSIILVGVKKLRS